MVGLNCVKRLHVADGETNLKHKIALPDVNRLFTNDEEASRSRGLNSAFPK